MYLIVVDWINGWTHIRCMLLGDVRGIEYIDNR